MTPTITPTRMTAWLEQAWLVRYLDRRLASEEANWFEAYVLDKPELLAMIEADTRLREALAADASTRHMERSVDGGRLGGATADAAHVEFDPGDAGETDLAGPGPAHAAPISGDRARPRRRTGSALRWLPIAASLLLGLGLGWVGTRSLVGERVPSVIANPTRVVYDMMRGARVAPRVELADSASPYTLIEVAVPPGAEHITLKVGDDPEQALSPTADGFVTLLVQKKKMGAGTTIAYEIAAAEGPRKITMALAPPPNSN